MDIMFDLLRYSGYLIITLVALTILAIIIASLASRGKSKDSLDLTHLNKEHDQVKLAVSEQILSKKDFKKLSKTSQEIEKKSKDQNQKRLFVLDFKGDVKASEVENLRKEINTILSVSAPGDEVILRLESPGGMVHTYGLAAAQLERVKEAGLKLTICVDRVAASGGYMMACVGHLIYAAPFAMVGSIGVVAQVPNFNKLLKKHDVDYHEITAGQYKRTLTLFGEVTSEKLHKFSEQIQDIHILFKSFIHRNRPQLDLSQVATGEYWYGVQAKDLNLIDEVKTSDDVILAKMKDYAVYALKIRERKSVGDRLSEAIETSLTKILTSPLQKLGVQRLGLEKLSDQNQWEQKLWDRSVLLEQSENLETPFDLEHKSSDPLV